MKFAAVMPYPDDYHLMDMTSYHLVIATEVVKHLREWSARIHYWRLRGDFIILDNGAPEEGSMSLQRLVDLAELLYPDEIVLPDALDDMDGTLRGVYDHPTLVERIPVRQRFFVPQGKTMDERITCLRAMTVLFATLGIPKRSCVPLPCGRLEALSAMSVGGDWNIHILGLKGNPLEELKMFEPIMFRVRGCDSGAPAAWAQHGKHFVDGIADESYSVDLGQPLDLIQSNAARIMTYQIMEACDAMHKLPLD